MIFPSKVILEQLRRRYPEGTRIELIHMDDPYNKKLGPGSKGTDDSWTRREPCKWTGTAVPRLA